MKFYPLFRNDDKGKRLSKVFDKGMQKLYNSGVLEKIYKGSKHTSEKNIDPILYK